MASTPQKKSNLLSDSDSAEKMEEDNKEAKEEKEIQPMHVNEPKQVTRWEKQWAAIQNVIEFGQEILVKKWVLVHDSEENRKKSDSHSQYSEFSEHESIEEKVLKKGKKDSNKKHICQFPACGKIFADSSTPILMDACRFFKKTHGYTRRKNGIIRLYTTTIVCVSALWEKVFR